MATLSQSDYADLAPYIPMINMYSEHGIYVGCDIFAFKKVYDRVANDNLNPSCGGCIANALNRTSDLIKEYENGNSSNS